MKCEASKSTSHACRARAVGSEPSSSSDGSPLAGGVGGCNHQECIRGGGVLAGEGGGGGLGRAPLLR